MIARFRLGSPEASLWLESLDARRDAASDSALDAASRVSADVRKRGDEAVAEIVRRFDKVSLSGAELSIIPTRESIDAELSDAIDLAIARIESYHAEQRPLETRDDDREIVERVRPLRRVAVYVPGGSAVYLSTLIMGVVPARLAGVEEIVVLTTPAAAATPELREIAARLGVSAIYRGGGAGIAAAAWGTASMPRVDKIVGPGSRFVTALKQLLYGRVGIDMAAGPSEIAVIADDSGEPDLIAADLLAQSEHGEDSAAVAVVPAAIEKEVFDALERRLATLPADAAARRSLAANGAIAVAATIDEAIDFVNVLAPEHVAIQTREPRLLAGRIVNSGAIFAGRWSAVALGDYTAGTNHILPTAGGGRFFSPLGVRDFLKSSHVVGLSQSTYREIRNAAELLAVREGLPLHAASIAAREAS